MFVLFQQLIHFVVPVQAAYYLQFKIMAYNVWKYVCCNPV